MTSIYAAKRVTEEKAQTPDAPRRRRLGHLLSASTSKETFGFSIVLPRSGVCFSQDSWFTKWSVNSQNTHFTSSFGACWLVPERFSGIRSWQNQEI